MSLVTPRSHRVVIYQGDDLEHLTELRQAAEAARRQVRAHQEATKSGSARHGDAPSAADEELAYNEAVLEAAERAVVVEVRNIGRKKFRDLMLEHPARKVQSSYVRQSGEEITEMVTHPDDVDFGVNTETFAAALLTYVDPDDTEKRTISEPALSKKELTEFLDDDIADGQFEELWLTAWSLNRSGGADPKATLYSTGSPTTT